MMRRLWLALAMFGATATSGRSPQILFYCREYLHPRTVRPLTAGEQGQALAEEALILVLVGVVAVAALTAMQVSIADAFLNVAGSLSRLDPQNTPRSR